MLLFYIIIPTDESSPWPQIQPDITPSILQWSTRFIHFGLNHLFESHEFLVPAFVERVNKMALVPIFDALAFIFSTYQTNALEKLYCMTINICVFGIDATP